MSKRLTLLLLLAISSIPFALSLDYESSQCTYENKTVASCSGYSICNSYIFNVPSLCDTDTCLSYETITWTEPVAKEVCSDKNYNCNCLCTEYAKKWDSCASTESKCSDVCVEEKKDCSWKCNAGWSSNCYYYDECVQTKQECSYECKGGFSNCAYTTTDCSNVCVSSHKVQKTCKFLWYTWDCSYTVCDRYERKCTTNCHWGWSSCASTQKVCKDVCTKTEKKKVCVPYFDFCATKTYECGNPYCVKTEKECTDSCKAGEVTDYTNCLKQSCQTCTEKECTNITSDITYSRNDCIAYEQESCIIEESKLIATIPNCENLKPVLSLKLCKDYPCTEQTVLEEGKEYYIEYSAERIFHNGKADVTVKINDASFNLKTENYVSPKGVYSFTAELNSQFEVSLIDNIDSETITQTISLPVLTKEEVNIILSEPFDPNEGSSETTEEEFSVISGFFDYAKNAGTKEWAAAGLIGNIGLISVLFANYLREIISNEEKRKKLLKKLKNILTGDTHDFEEAAGDAAISFIPVVGILTDIRDFVKALFGKEDKFIGFISLIGIFTEVTFAGDFATDGVKAFLKLSKNKWWYKTLMNMPNGKIASVLKSLVFHYKNGLKNLDEFMDSLANLWERTKRFDKGADIVARASKLRAQIVIAENVDEETLKAIEKMINYAQSAEDLKYKKLNNLANGIEGKKVTKVIFTTLEDGVGGRYNIKKGTIEININTIKNLMEKEMYIKNGKEVAENSLFSLMHHEYMHSFTTQFDDEIREILSEIDPKYLNCKHEEVLNEAHDLVTLALEQKLEPERAQKLLSGYKELLKETESIKMIDLFSESDTGLQATRDFIRSLDSSELQKAKLAEWFVVEEKSKDIWQNILKKIDALPLTEMEKKNFENVLDYIKTLEKKYDTIYRGIIQ